LTDAILVVNAGSSSLKFAVYAAAQWIARGEVANLGASASLKTVRADADALVRRVDAATIADALRIALDWLGKEFPDARYAAVGHRIVHGGTRFTAPALLDAAMLDELETLDPLAPLHQPYALAAARQLLTRFPHALSVGCFDTAFHAGWDDAAQRLALPRRFHDGGLRRYGFHGLSCEYLSARVRELAPQAGRVVIAHLGSGASISAVRAGRSIESTMGFSVVDGLPMATRCGEIGAGAIFHLHRQYGLGFDAIEHMLYYDSGLAGVSGFSADMRTLLADSGGPARQAVALYAHRCTAAIGAMAAVLGGVDALVFSGGVGAHAGVLRDTICRPLAFLGIALDPGANAANEQRVSAADSALPVFALVTDEEGVIATHCRAQLAARGRAQTATELRA
jgi:acetate kinase